MASSLGGLWQEEWSVNIQGRLSSGEAKCRLSREGQVDLEGVY